MTAEARSPAPEGEAGIDRLLRWGLVVGNCGLYLGPFGVRVEDTVLVNADGHSVLTTFARNLA